MPFLKGQAVLDHDPYRQAWPHAPSPPQSLLLLCTAETPKVLHYGLLWQVAGTQYSFDKHWHYQFDPLSCPPWEIGWVSSHHTCT
jgi:hypothetical protein